MYKKSKKSQGMSINVIIIVAICLIVLVVLIAIFTGRMGNFVKGVDTTATCGNACKSFDMEKSATLITQLACVPPNRYVPGTFKDSGIGACCCS